MNYLRVTLPIFESDVHFLSWLIPCRVGGGIFEFFFSDFEFDDRRWEWSAFGWWPVIYDWNIF